MSRMHKTSFRFLPVFFLLSLISPPAGAGKTPPVFQSPPASLISVSSVAYSEKAPGKFLVTGTLQNPSPEAREVVVRGQLTFYDQSVPPGDIPLFILRKDTTLILKPSGSQSVEVPLINEGGLPRGALRIEPMLRVRRQRVWNY